MPAPSFILLFGTILVSFSIRSGMHRGNPFRISSHPKGAPIRPAACSIVEDVIAVDTGAERKYRKAIDDRWRASPTFVAMLWQMNLFWGIPASLLGVAIIVVVSVQGGADNR